MHSADVDRRGTADDWADTDSDPPRSWIFESKNRMQIDLEITDVQIGYYFYIIRK